MPRFFFDTFDGETLVPDPEGQDLDSLGSAKTLAQVALAEIARDALPNGDQRTFIISVRDEGQQAVMRVALSLVVDYPDQNEKV